MKATFLRFFGCSRGATAIEYGLIATLIAVMLAASVTSAGQSLADAYDTIRAAIASLDQPNGGPPAGKGNGNGNNGNGNGNGGGNNGNGKGNGGPNG
jgi:Flp pilus assembly pilin Flp